MQTLEQFGQTIQQKYPQYSDIPAAELGQKMLAKYPQYADMVDTSTPNSNLATPPSQNFLEKAGNIVNSIFPGKQVGQTIGTLGGLGITAAKEKLGLAPKGATQAYDTSAPSPFRVAGDVAQGVLTVAAPEIGKGATVLGRIGANTALGAGIGTTGAIAEGKNLSNTAKAGLIGGVIGGVGTTVEEGLGSMINKLPGWFTKLALPKLGDNLKGTPQETIDYALNNTKGATLNKMYANSKNAINSYENQIQAVLTHPQYVNETGNITQGLKTVQSSFPNAGLDENKIVSIVKQVAPENKTLVDKVAKGTATLEEQNVLRKELDQATKKAYGDKPNLSFAKQVGKSMADFLRGNVKDTAKETVPIFSEYSKEHTLNRALGTALSKKRVAGPLVAGAAGFAGGGLSGAIKGIAIEEGLRSPTARLLVAKGVKNLAKSAPVIGGIIQGVKAPVIKKITD